MRKVFVELIKFMSPIMLIYSVWSRVLFSSVFHVVELCRVMKSD